MNDPKDLVNAPISRRTVLASASLIPIAAITAVPQEAFAQAPSTVFAPEQRRILLAFIDRLIPSDEFGPGAIESGAGDYIERCLTDDLANEKAFIIEGLSTLDAFSRSSQGASFAEIPPEKRDAVLTAIDNDQAPNLKTFFSRVRRLTLEGMFSDPYWGGNKNFAGWDLIRYPGAKLAAAPQDQSMKTPPVRVRKSVYGGNHGH